MCRENFSSAVIRDIEGFGEPAVCAGAYLTQYINSLAGDKPCAQWFHRQADGSGLGMQGIDLQTSLQARRLPKEAFPGYLMRSQGHDANHSILLEEFFRWQAPWLLLLPDLGSAERQALEQHARPQALIIEKQFRLYPQIIDEALVKAARVEAMLRRQGQQQKSEEDVMSTFYIELHPSPTE